MQAVIWRILYAIKNIAKSLDFGRGRGNNCLISIRELVQTRKTCHNRRLAAAQGAPHLYIYLTLLDPINQGHRFGQALSPDPHIRLMVDVLLTMNEASRYAEGKFTCCNFLATSRFACG